MKNKSLFALPLLLLLCAFTDPGGRYSIYFPDGWDEPFEAGKAIQAQSKDAEHVGWCRVNSNVLESLKDAKQADLNAEFAKPLSHQLWADMLGFDADKFEIADGESRIVDGAIVQEVTLTLPAGMAGDTPTKARMASWILPGRVLNAACFTAPEDFAGYESEFRRVVGSLRPR